MIASIEEDEQFGPLINDDSSTFEPEVTTRTRLTTRTRGDGSESIELLSGKETFENENVSNSVEPQLGVGEDVPHDNLAFEAEILASRK